MLLKNAIMAQVCLCAVLISSHAYAMDDDVEFTTPVSKNTRGANAAGPNAVNKENYAAVSQRLWGDIDRYKEHDTIDKGNAKAVFDLLTTHLAEEEKIKALRGLLPIEDEIDLRVQLFNVEQASDATDGTPK